MPKRKVSKPVKKSTKKVAPVKTKTCVTPEMPLDAEQLNILQNALGYFLRAGSSSSGGFFRNKKNAKEAWKYLKDHWRQLDGIMCNLGFFDDEFVYNSKDNKWCISTETCSTSGCVGSKTWWRDDGFDPDPEGSDYNRMSDDED